MIFTSDYRKGQVLNSLRIGKLNIDTSQCQHRPKVYREFHDKFEAKITSEKEENMAAITT